MGRDRLRVGCIGTGSRWDGVGPNAMEFADCVAVCDVDGRHRAKAQRKVVELQQREVEAYEDYRQVLDRSDVDVVTIVTPWTVISAVNRRLMIMASAELFTTISSKASTLSSLASAAAVT